MYFWENYFVFLGFHFCNYKTKLKEKKISEALLFQIFDFLKIIEKVIGEFGNYKYNQLEGNWNKE